MTARDDILRRIRAARAAAPALAADGGSAAAARLAGRPRGPSVARTALDRPGLVGLFVEKAVAAAATVDRVDTFTAVPAALADYLARENLPAAVVMAPDSALDACRWEDRPLLAVRRGRAEAGDAVSVTGAFAAVAETGTLVLTSGAGHPTTLNFLPETHVVVLRAADVAAGLEDVWDRLRAVRGADMPRTVNMVTGPSRSADIGQELQMGAHGPRRLHILLVRDP